MTLHDTIHGWIRETLDVQADFVLEYPGDYTHGDFATNIALVTAKGQKTNPKELAEAMAVMLQKNKIPEISKIEVAGPGFINLTLTPELFSSVVEKINAVGVTFGEHIEVSGKKVIVEYTQPNVMKEFHVGHMMNNVIGEATSRIVESQGAEVVRATYHGDVGLHIAKAVWGVINVGVGTDITVKILGEAYAYGSKLYETDELAKKEIIEINKKIYDKSDEQINILYDKGRQVSLHYFESMYARLGSTFNYHFYESESGPLGKKIVEEFVEHKVFETSEGAVVFKGENFGLHTRVYVSSQGLPTYEAKEVGLMQIKRDLFSPFDLSITVTANEQDAFFKVVEKSLEQVFPELNGKLLHLSHGILKLPTGKMSSRTGDVLRAEDVIDVIKESAKEKIKDELMSRDREDAIAEIVALGAIKYSILRQAIGGDVVFDVSKALSLEGDSGPYLQYATVRASTVLRKAEGVMRANSELPGGWETTHVERLLERFPHMLRKSAREYAPHILVTYLTELAGSFNSFYGNHKIIDTTDTSAPYKLAITRSFVDVMTSGLHLLGIQVPESM